METVLLIESNPANLVALALILRCLGYSVLEAANHDEGWFACQQHRGEIHLAITKAVFKNQATSEFLAQLLRVYPQMRVLLTHDEPLAKSTEMPPGYGLLQTPFRVETFGDTIKALLEGPGKRAATSLL